MTASFPPASLVAPREPRLASTRRFPVFQIDENAKTATLTFHQILPANLYSFFGGKRRFARQR